MIDPQASTELPAPVSTWRCRLWQLAPWLTVGLLGTQLVSRSAPRGFMIALLAIAICSLNLRLPRWSWGFIAFSLGVLTVSAIHGDPFEAKQLLYSWLPVVLVSAISFTDRHRSWLIRLNQIGLLYACVLIILQTTIGYDRDARPFRIDWSGELEHDYDRPTGSWHHWVHFGIAWSMSSLIVLYYQAHAWPGSRLAAGATVAQWVVIAALNRTRMAIATWLVLAPWVAARGRGIGQRWALGLSLGILATGIVAVIALTASGGGGSRLDVQQDGRWRIWNASTQMIGDNAMLGVGPERFKQASAEYQPPIPSNEAVHAHNSALAISVEFGIPVAVLWLLAHAILVVHCWRSRAWFAVAILMMYHGCGLLDHLAGRSDLTILAFGLVGLDLAVQRQRNSEGANEPESGATGTDGQ